MQITGRISETVVREIKVWNYIQKKLGCPTLSSRDHHCSPQEDIWCDCQDRQQRRAECEITLPLHEDSHRRKRKEAHYSGVFPGLNCSVYFAVVGVLNRKLWVDRGPKKQIKCPGNVSLEMRSTQKTSLKHPFHSHTSRPFSAITIRRTL